MMPPPALPLQLMLAMMQSGLSPLGSMPSNADWLSSMAQLNPALNPNLNPFLPKPKSPLEQSVELFQNLWQHQSAQLLNAFSPKQTPSANDEGVSFLRKQESPSAQEIPAFAGMANFEELKQYALDFFNPEFLTTLSEQATEASAGFLDGVQSYLGSSYKEPEREYEAIWQRGSAQLFDLAPDSVDAVAVLCIPSLINRSTILDLYPGASLVEFLKAQGFRPLILDWGAPGEEEEEFTSADYITSYAIGALQHLREHHEGPIALLGYCMGGIFTTAMAQLAPLFVDALVLLATPWDFSAKDSPRVLHDVPTQLMLRQWMATQNPVAPLVTQTVFHLIDPFHVQRKYARLPLLKGAERTHFLAVEHWVNDGVPLARAVAEECFIDWPQGNILAQHQWKVGRRWIEPETIKCPTLAFIPEHDLIVPKGVALPLTKLIKRCEVQRPKAGHVSMVVGKNAKAECWEPLARWLHKKF